MIYMNEKDMMIKINLLEERQHVQANHLKDVDECCGKIQGNTDGKIQHITERIVGIEHDMNNNCKDVELDLAAAKEVIKTQCKNIETNSDEIEKIHERYYQFSIAIILSFVTALIGILVGVR